MMKTYPIILIYFLFFFFNLARGQSLPYLPPELISAFKEKMPTKLPQPVSTGKFRKLPAGKGFVWIAEVKEAAVKGNQLAFRMNFDSEIQENEVAFIAIRARTVRHPHNKEQKELPGKVRIHLAEREDLSQTALYHIANIGEKWGWYFHPFRAAKAIRENAGVVRFSFDTIIQAIEIEEVRLYIATKGFDMARLPMMSTGYQGRKADAKWRKQADQRIQKYRTGPLQIKVTDPSGKPLKHTTLDIRMLRHAFGFGSTFKSKYLLDNSEDAIRYRKVFDDLFSCLVPVPSLIPRHTPNMHTGNYANQQLLGLGRVLQWGCDRHMSFRGHTLVWGNLQPWSNKLVEKKNPEGILNFLKEHRNYILPLTKNVINEWDAINHPIRFQKDLRDVFGDHIYRDLLAEQRRSTDATLIINEALFDNTREENFYNFMVKLQDSRRTKADGIGFQSHYTIQNLRGMEDIWRRYERFAPLVNRMVVTEYDLVCNDDQLHADYLRDILTLTFSHPKMTGFINWGFWAGDHWKPEGALIRKEWKERPAVTVWRELVKGKWWTETTVETDLKGHAIIEDAFYGYYEIRDRKIQNSQVIEHLNGNETVSIVLP